MTRDVLIGIDAGTSVIKAVAFDLDGRQLASASRPNVVLTRDDGGAEQDMDRTWGDTADTLRRLATELPDLKERTAAVAVTGQGDGTWLIDADGRPVTHGWLWLDGRAATLVEELRASEAGRRVFERNGCGLNTCQMGAQLAWMKRRRPEWLEAAATALHPKDWLYFRLTGERATDLTEGTFTFGDFRKPGYAPEILAALGIPELRRLLPPMLDGSREAHPLSADAAKATGLGEGTPVVLGPVDFMAVALGGGLYDRTRDLGCSIIGSTGIHTRLFHDLDSITLNADQTGYTAPFPVPGTWAQMQSNMAATLNIDWIVDRAVEVLGAFGVERSRAELLPAIDGRVLGARPGAVLYHPYIYEAGERGPFVDPFARAQFLGISTRVGFFDLVRAVYEGLALAARDCYEAMGHAPPEVRLAGGGSRSRALRVILASALGVPVRCSSREETGAAGAAMMAAVHVGRCPDLAAACAAWADPLLTEATPPDPDLTPRYDALFPAYRRGYRAMHELWRDLDALRRGDHA